MKRIITWLQTVAGVITAITTIVGALIALVGILHANGFFASKNNTDDVYKTVTSYYNDINKNNAVAANYFDNKIDQFISYKNISVTDLQQRINESYSEFINGKSVVDRNSLAFMREVNGVKYYQYKIHYACYRKSLSKNESCDVLIEVGVTNSLKFVSYIELKISNLVFS